MNLEIIDNGEKFIRTPRLGKFNSITKTHPPARPSENPTLENIQTQVDQIQPHQDFNLIWISLWHDIETDLGGLMKSMDQAYHQWQTSLNIGINPARSNAQWYSFLYHFKLEITRINARVREYNQQVPVSTFQKPFYVADTIITKLRGQAG